MRYRGLLHLKRSQRAWARASRPAIASRIHDRGSYCLRADVRCVGQPGVRPALTAYAEQACAEDGLNVHVLTSERSPQGADRLSTQCAYSKSSANVETSEP